MTLIWTESLSHFLQPWRDKLDSYILFSQLYFKMFLRFFEAVVAGCFFSQLQEEMWRGTDAGLGALPSAGDRDVSDHPTRDYLAVHHGGRPDHRQWSVITHPVPAPWSLQRWCVSCLSDISVNCSWEQVAGVAEHHSTGVTPLGVLPPSSAGLHCLSGSSSWDGKGKKLCQGHNIGKERRLMS